MPDQPTADLRTLADSLITDEVCGMFFDAYGSAALDEALGMQNWPRESTQIRAGLRAVLAAAVLPAHWAMVLAEAAAELDQIRDGIHQDLVLDTPDDQLAYRTSRGVLASAAQVLRRLAATGPTTSPASTSPAQDGPAVPGEPDGHSGAQGERGQPTSWDIAHREGRAQILAAIFDIDTKTAHRLASEHWRPTYRQPFPPDPYDCGHDPEAFDRQADELAQVRADVERLTRERDEYAAESRRLGDFANAKVQEVKALRGQRIVAAVFGHHKDAPRPFALHRPGFGPIADGVEFSDGRVALRELRQGLAPRVTTYDRMETLAEGHPDDFGPNGVQIVWLSDELEPLAEMEADRDRLADTVRRVRELHAPFLKGGTEMCDACSPPTGPERLRHHVLVPWPCPTIAALGDAGQDPTHELEAPGGQEHAA